MALTVLDALRALPVPTSAMRRASMDDVLSTLGKVEMELAALCLVNKAVDAGHWAVPVQRDDCWRSLWDGRVMDERPGFGLLCQYDWLVPKGGTADAWLMRACLVRRVMRWSV